MAVEIYNLLSKTLPNPLEQQTFATFACPLKDCCDAIPGNKRLMHTVDIVTHIRFAVPTEIEMEICTENPGVGFKQTETIEAGTEVYRLKYPLPLFLWAYGNTFMHNVPPTAEVRGILLSPELRDFWGQ